MNFGIDLTSTTGGSLPGLPCPECGHVAALPRLSAEELLFRLPGVFPLAVAMPDGSMALSLAGVIYAVPADEWTRFTAMRAD